MEPKGFKGTPGEWAAEFDEEGGYDYMTSAYLIRANTDTQQRLVTSVDITDYDKRLGWHGKHPEAEANARLMAASKDLAAALQGLLEIAKVATVDGTPFYKVYPLEVSFAVRALEDKAGLPG